MYYSYYYYTYYTTTDITQKRLLQILTGADTKLLQQLQILQLLLVLPAGALVSVKPEVAVVTMGLENQ